MSFIIRTVSRTADGREIVRPITLAQPSISIGRDASNDINLAECAPTGEVADAAQRIVDESGLQGWTVAIRADSVQAICAKTAVDAPTRTVTIIKFP